VIGVGASYKVGWGQNIRNISVSSQGVGFRSFADYKIKGSFFASGGFEYNYQQPFSSVSIVRDLDNWQQSGLAGISKIISLKSKMFKKTKMQLLWDFLSYSQRPQTQPLKFRVGYNF
jgi:trimethylamine:corrinoid methyltransferase-like protein